MISQEIFEVTEKEVEEMLAGILGDSDSSSESRIESIMKRVRVETLIKESTGALVEGIPSGLKGIANAVKEIVKNNSEPPTPSY